MFFIKKAIKRLVPFNIHFFGEGGAAAGAAASGAAAPAAGEQGTGVSADLSNVVYGKSEGQAQAVAAGQPAVEDTRAAEFEKMINGDYKDAFNSRVQSIITKRLKASEAKVKAFDAIAPTLETLNSKYGLKEGDYDGLNAAIDNDLTYWEDKALEKGMPVEEYKAMVKMERENREMKNLLTEREKQENGEKAFAALLEEEKHLQTFYPNFSLKEESKNPNFGKLVQLGFELKDVYEMLHKDELFVNGIAKGYQQAEKKISASIAAGARRPTESAMTSRTAAIVKNDASQYKHADFQEIRRRVKNGERIVL